jgi:trehalose 6-phosphate phosphatase
LRGLPLRAIVGNHGGDVDGENYTHRVEQWKVRLQSAIHQRPGIWIEDKVQSLAIHYRASDDKSGARKLLKDAASSLEGARLVQAKLAINLVPDDAPNKGDALHLQRNRLKCDAAIFIGDDRTDEDVFAHSGPAELLGIRVGRSRESKAQYCIRDQRQVNALLRELIRLRQ